MDAGAALRKLFGGLLMAAGVLIALTGGACGGLGVFWAVGYWGTGDQRDTLLLSLVGGALSVVTGVTLFLAGQGMARSASGSPEDARAAGEPDP